MNKTIVPFLSWYRDTVISAQPKNKQDEEKDKNESGKNVQSSYFNENNRAHTWKKKNHCNL